MKPLVKPIVMEQEKRTNDTKLNWIVPYRICTAVLSITTISLSMMQGITNPEWDMGKGDVFNFFNGFAYFTIQSNILDAPRILDFLCTECSDHFSAVKSYLDELKLAYEINPRMVRGLDLRYLRCCYRGLIHPHFLLQNLQTSVCTIFSPSCLS